MPPIDSKVNVFSPQSLGDLLALKHRKPEVVAYAGGTFLLHGKSSKFPTFPESLVSIRQIEELRRFNRSERYLEIGSCVTLSQIGRFGGRAVPSILMQAIETIASAPVRSLATLGGNVCVPGMRLSAYPALFLLDARVELRELGNSRWVPINRFSGADGNLIIQPTEVLTRIRVPLGDWNTQVYRSIGSGINLNEWSLSFCGLANIDRSVLSDFRFALGCLGKKIIRNREIETELMSRKLPLPDRELDMISVEFDRYVTSVHGELISAYQCAMASKLFRWFIFSLEAS